MENEIVDLVQQPQVVRSKTHKKVHFRSMVQDGHPDTMEDRHNLLQCLNWQCCNKHGCITIPYELIDWRTSYSAPSYINRSLPPAANLGAVYHQIQSDKETANKHSLVTIPTITLTTDQNINGRPKMDNDSAIATPEIVRTTTPDPDPDQDQDTRSSILPAVTASESASLPSMPFMGSGLLLDDSTPDLDEPHLHDDAPYSFNNLPTRMSVENLD